jgi:hypothetical protein
VAEEAPIDQDIPKDLELEFQRAIWRGATEIIVDASWSARSLQKAAACWATVVLVLGLPANVLASVTATGAGAAAIFVRNAALTAILALIAAALTGMKAVLKPEETYQGYASKGSAYLALRNDTRHFRNVRLRTVGVSPDQFESELKALTSRLNALSQQPPVRIPTWAYKQAKESIEAGESDYKGDRFWEDPPF